MFIVSIYLIFMYYVHVSDKYMMFSVFHQFVSIIIISTMSSRKTKGKSTKKRAQRATSNVFAMFDQSQIQEFKEAFSIIDQNRDGFIDKEDLGDMQASLGKMILFSAAVITVFFDCFIFSFWKTYVKCYRLHFSYLYI